jgi:16S rRNA (uracil1498-N3)-methyltransferase
MRTIRLHTDQPLATGQTIELEPGPARHLVRVLRQRVGDPVTLFNGDGSEHAGVITAIEGKQSCRVELRASHQPERESPLAISLVQAIGRGERMDYSIQKAVELGVAEIQPVFSERTEVRLGAERADKRLAHWQQVAIAACEQSGRVRLPRIHPPAPLHEVRPGTGLNLFLDPLAKLGPTGLETPESLAASIVIGPEGGLSEAEIDQLTQLGFTGLRIGPRVLRTETAGPAVIALLQARFGDWQ